MVPMIYLITIFILFLLLLIINAFAIVGFHLATGEGMILNFIRKLLEEKTEKAYAETYNPPVFIGMVVVPRKIPKRITKPLYDCPTCMASLHSIYVYWGAYFLLKHYQFDIELLTMICAYPVYILALSAMATIVYNQTE